VKKARRNKKRTKRDVEIRQEGKLMYVCLHQIRAVDYRRLSSRFGMVDEEDFKKIKTAFWRLYQ